MDTEYSIILFFFDIDEHNKVINMVGVNSGMQDYERFYE